MKYRVSSSSVVPFVLMPMVVVVGVTITACSLFKSEDDEAKYTPGETYFGRNEYIEYGAGDVPIILTVPYGGYLEPDEIPDRQYGIGTPHPNTQELTRAIAAALNNRLGRHVHLIVCNLKRSKLDAGSTLLDGAEGNEYAEQAWNEYHDFIEDASKAVERTWKRGLYLDIHGHTHEKQRIELGYVIDPGLYGMSDYYLNDWEIRDLSSISTLAREADAKFVELLRGPMSLGTLLENAGYPAIPSSQQPNPGVDPYNTGDRCVKVYGSKMEPNQLGNDPIDAIQITCNWDNVRDTEANWTAFAQAFAEVLETFVETHYKFDLQAGPF